MGKASPERLREHRRTRFERRQQASRWLIAAAREAEGRDPYVSGVTADHPDWVRPPAPARCRWRIGETVGVHHEQGTTNAAHFSGTFRCGSVWSCPVCAAVIRAHRADEIGRAVAAHLENGGGALFVTLTMRHKHADELHDTLDTAMLAWRKVQTGAPWGRFKDQIGYAGSIRTTEITYGASGWHPHHHVLLLTDRPMTKDAAEAAESSLSALWIRRVVALGGRTPTRAHGVRVEAVDGQGQVLAQYLAKVQEHQSERRTDIGKELARGDLKTGKAGSLMPFELLDDESGSPVPQRLWSEYYAATYGRRAFSWSRGLRDRLLPAEDELTDDEVLDEAEKSPIVFHIAGRAYDRLKNQAAMLALVLDLTERGQVELAKTVAAGAFLDEQHPKTG